MRKRLGTHSNSITRSRRRFRPLGELLEPRLCLSAFYDFTVVAKTGDLGTTGFTQVPSINDTGQVAVVGHTANGDVILAHDGTALQNLSGTPNANTTYLASAQINNAGQVLASERDFSPNFRSLKLWDVNNPGTEASLAGSGVAGTSILTFASLSNTADPVTGAGIAFGAIASPGAGVSLQQPNPPLGFGTLIAGFNGVGVNLRPAVANSGALVYHSGNGNTITLLDQGNSVVIASSLQFTELGISPSISDDGQIVVFYGNLSEQGAKDLTKANGDHVPVPLTPGEGIFASVEFGGARYVIRVAGKKASGYVDPGERQLVGGVEAGPDFNFDGASDWGIEGFDPSSRVSVSLDPSGEFGTVAYLGTDESDGVTGTGEAIFASRVDLYPSAVGVEAYVRVARVNQPLGSFGGATDLAIYDAINAAGQVAFWASNGTNEAVIKTHRTSDHPYYLNGLTRFRPDSPLVEYVMPATVLTKYTVANRTASDINQIILHATVGYERGAIRELTTVNNPNGIHYLVSREGRITQIVLEKDRANHAFPDNLHSVGIELIDNEKHRTDPNWDTPIQVKKTGLLARDIALRNDITITQNGAQIIPLLSPRNDLLYPAPGCTAGQEVCTSPFAAGWRPADAEFPPLNLPPLGPYEMRGNYRQGTLDPVKNAWSDGFDGDAVGILGHGQVLNRTGPKAGKPNADQEGKDDPRNWDWKQFMTWVNGGTIVEVHSPANLLITDPQGRRAGVDPVTGQEVLEIPGAQFSGAGSEPQFLSLPDGLWSLE